MLAHAASSDLPCDQDAILDALLTSSHAMHDISTEGGYLWKYSSDLRKRSGEKDATNTQVWIQYPGTPAMGNFFIHAWNNTGEEAFLVMARDAAHCLVMGQLESGGWDYLIEFDPEKRSQWRYRIDGKTRGRNRSTYDDDNTQSALSFLLHFQSATREAGLPIDTEVEACLRYGLDKLLLAQYPNGAFPQRWDGEPHDPDACPILPASIDKDYPREYSKQKYYHYYTLNDGCQQDAMRVLVQAWQYTGDQRFEHAVRNAADFLLLAQLPAPQTGWAQQYDPDMHPAWARAFEPPALVSGESVAAANALLDLYPLFMDPRYIEAAQSSLDWMLESQISDNKWARFYELETNRPIYSDRDGKIYYSLDSISEERRNGYGWQGDFNIPKLQKRLAKLDELGLEAWTKKEKPAFDFYIKTFNDSDIRKQLESVIKSLNPEGFWLSQQKVLKEDESRQPAISTHDFLMKSYLLLDAWDE